MEMASTNPVVGKIDPNLLYLSLSPSCCTFASFLYAPWSNMPHKKLRIGNGDLEGGAAGVSQVQI